MPNEGALPPAVKRVLDRDDLMMLARDAEAAVDIVREGVRNEHVFRHEGELFSEALKMYSDTGRNAAQESNSRSIVVDSLDCAGVIAQLCDLLKVDLTAPVDVDVTAFHTQALAMLEAASETLAGAEIDQDLYRGRTVRYRAARDLRIRGSYEAAISLNDLPDNEFVGNGADIFRAHFHYELAACHLLSEQVAEVRPVLEDALRNGFWKAVATSQFVSRHRVDYALALARWAVGDRDEAADLLAKAQRYLHRTGRKAARYDLEDLLLSMAQADLLIEAGAASLPAVNRVVDHLDHALHIIEGIRGRWRVIARSASPLSAAIRRVYGDIARAASGVPGRQAAELGLRVALSAKQSGFAGRLRADRSAVDGQWRTWRKGRRLRSLLETVVKAETEQLGGPTAGGEKDLHDLRLRIEEAVSPLLADAVMPAPATIARVIDLVGDRYALDYVGLPDTVTGETSWFRTLIEPTGAISFCQLTVGEALSAFVAAIRPATVDLARVLAGGVDWQALGDELIPRRLRDVLALSDDPITLVISAHSALSLMPWAALGLDGHTRLVERAVITQTPVLTCLSGPATGGASGPALIHLVPTSRAGDDELDIGLESATWGIASHNDGHALLSECALEQGARPVDLPGTLAAALSDETGQWRYAHIASHGQGSGLGQTLVLPGAPISAGRALTLRWPQSLLIASCHVGRLVNIEHAEPLNFVMAVLAGGGEQVVACIDGVGDFSAGETAADIVRRSMDGVRLEIALREAQLEWIRGRWPDSSWILFAAYTR
ncbi:CHAT domain-containing protein [Micromonospora sp. NPDC049275]|uniref:CHAT domain-containing protein n=1 Tax=Micromonospora sp. NPDC049275 TaxID=3364268 RepID=UPI0037137CFF